MLGAAAAQQPIFVQRHKQRTFENWKAQRRKGDAEAQFKLGPLLYNGQGVGQIIAKRLTVS